MAKKRVKKAPRRGKKAIEDIRDFAPPWLAWVADHPLLHSDLDDLTGEEIDKASKYPAAPSEFSVNVLKQCQLRPARIENLIMRVAKFQADARKKEDAANVQKEDEDIATLEAAMAAALGDTVVIGMGGVT